jgi:hypothetical protein
MQSLDGDALADLEFLTVCRSLGDKLAVLTSDDGKLAELLQLGGVSTGCALPICKDIYHLIVASSMVPVADAVY